MTNPDLFSMLIQSSDEKHADSLRAVQLWLAAVDSMDPATQERSNRALDAVGAHLEADSRGARAAFALIGVLMMQLAKESLRDRDLQTVQTALSLALKDATQ
jgi:hypothetical protein